MSTLRDVVAQNPAAWLAWGGLAIGIAFGFIVARTNFCTMGSISDIHNFGDWRRFRAWILAGATAIVGAQALQLAGVVDLSKSMYVAPSFNWVGYIAGGLMFGFGMVLAGGCASRNLARVGGGDLRSLMTLLVMAVFAYVTVSGLFAPVRDLAEGLTSIPLGRPQSLPSLATPALGARADVVVSALIAAAALVYCFKDRKFRASPVHVLAGLGIGLVVAAGWMLTGLAFDELALKPVAPVSLTFVRPTADTLEWLQRFTAAMVPGFGVTSVIGTIVGAFLASWPTGRFRLATFTDAADTRRNLAGAALMGVGGVTAMGCTLGQAITGVSTLALGSFLTFAAIVAGAKMGLRHLEKGLTWEV